MIVPNASSRAFSRIAHFALPAVLAVTLLLGAVARGYAHDHGVLKLASKTFKAGDSLTIGGAKFTRNEEVALVLVGVAGRVPLGDAPTDSAGGFAHSAVVPMTTKAGQYRLVAEAIDGDEVASLEVVVLPASAAASMEGMHGAARTASMPMDPTGEPLAFTRPRSATVMTAAIVLIIVCAVSGALLLRHPHANLMEDLS